MKAQFLISACSFFEATLLLQSCAVNSTLIDSKQVTVTHEHRVTLPAAMCLPKRKGIR